MMLAVALATVAASQAGAQTQTYTYGINTPTLPAGATTGTYENWNSLPFGHLFGCASGTCVGVGNTEALPSALFVTPFNDGTAGASAATVMPSDDDPSLGGGYQDLSCAAAGSCVAVGDYNNLQSKQTAFVESITGGQPGATTDPSTPSGSDTADPETSLNGVSCWSAGSCIAAGNYHTSTPNYEAMIVPVTGGRAGTGLEVTLPPGADPGASQSAILDGVSCWSAGSCLAVGTFLDSSDHSQALVVPITAGVPGAASEVTAPTGASGNPDGVLDSVSCTSSGSCYAVGYYIDSSGNFEGMVVPITDGATGTASGVSLPSDATPSGNVLGQLNAVSCAASGPCAAVGLYNTASGQESLVVPLATGQAPTGELAPTPIGPTGVAQSSQLTGVSCVSGGSCVAAGSFQDASNVEQGMVVTIPATGTPTGLQEAPAAEDVNAGNSSELFAVSCDTSGSCVAGGDYYNPSGDDVPYEVNIEVPLAVSSTSLAGGTVGSAYQQTSTATGAWGSYSWSVSTGSLPAGLSLNAQTGVISGTPTAAGTYSFTLQVSGAGLPAQTATQADSITIAAAAANSTPPAKPKVGIAGGRLQVKSNRFAVKLSCTGSKCSGTVKVDATETVTVKHGKKHIRKHRTVVIGSARFSIAAGHAANTTITLTGTGHRLLSRAKGHKLAVKLLASATSGNSASRSATLWQKAAKKKHRH
jgi:mRNA-degrading endonuclease toxin of MazEF toxin-antitoxin module